MKKLLIGISILPFVAGVALAQSPQPADQKVASAAPMQLTGDQMDKVTAGWSLFETDTSNVSVVQVSVWSGPLATCGSCYLKIVNPNVSVQSIFFKSLH